MYLKDQRDLRHILSTAPSAAVVLNKTQTSSNEQTLPLSQVLHGILEGDTCSFTALVGFFGHRGTATGGEETLADIIVQEARESLQDGQNFSKAAFRLAVGVNSSVAAQQALRIWYWLCRYRHEAPEGEAVTSTFQKAFLEHARATSFEEATRRLLRPLEPDKDGPEPYADSPFQLDSSDFSQRLSPRVEEGTARELEAAYTATVGAGRESAIRETTRTLLGFLLQRNADVRINPKKRVNGVTTVFHPKMYVVERGLPGDGEQTVSIVGSHNWTQSALGQTTASGVISNVEVATLHADPSHLWHENGIDEDSPLGHRVCSTARHLFLGSDFVLGAWMHDAGGQLLPAHRLKQDTKHVALGNTGQTEEKKPQYSAPPQPPRIPKALRELGPHLQKLAERLIGLGDFQSASWERYRSFFEDLSRTPFGYTPAAYQADAALRLMSMLGPTPQPASHTTETEYRGAFLTDETGLGKTITGQMVSAILLVERLKERTLYGRDIPLRASFIVPARLTGDESRASGWIGHSMDIKRAVRRLLEEEPSLNGRSVDDLMGLLEIEVFSIGAFSRRLFDVEDVADFGPGTARPFADIDVNGKVANDFLHIALSEVILIDESHNFRNDSSRRTRTFRFLSSLPLPGEEWTLRTYDTDRHGDAPEQNNNDESITRHPAIQRRMLCLSATPFNNDVSDLVTQMGHFDQYQDWTQAYNGADEVPAALAEALQFWGNASAAVRKSTLMPHFHTLLRHAARHLESSRSLSIREDKIAPGDDKRRAVTSDRGPRYEWQADNYVHVLRTVQQWAQARSDSPDDDGELSAEEKREKKEAQERMDSLLVDLFVQRSRARILRMAQSSRGEELGTMFRHPRVPRYPIALNEGPDEADDKDASSNFEREVLGGLYRLLGKSEEQVDEGDTLSFQSYKISINRSRSSGEGSTRTNFLGFQLTGLVKRLQSSPYSFFRTIVRGVLRHALTEFALVEYLVEGLSKERFGLPDRHLLKRNQAALENALDDVRSVLMYDYENTVEELHGVMGGLLLDEDHPAFFRSLTGCNENAEAHEQPRVKDFATAVDRTLDVLGEGQLELEGTEGGWLKDLIEDVKALSSPDDDVSLLWKDVRTVLDWVEHGVERDTDGLRTQLYKYIETEKTVGFAMGDVRKLCVRLVDDAPQSFRQQLRSLRNVTRWANHRLENDPRLRSLVAWLLIQARARSTSEADVPTERLRSGSRTLLFTEYTDTQEYILAVLAALGAAYQPFSAAYATDEKHHRRLQSDVEALTTQLKEEVQTISERLADWTSAVTSQGVDPDASHTPFARAELYEDPICRDTNASGHAPSWLQALIDGDVETMAETVMAMVFPIGRICSGTNHADTAHYLFPEDADTTGGPMSDPDDVTQEGNDPEPTNAIAEHEIVDAFSPWYQIEPRDRYRIADDDTLGDVEALERDCHHLRQAAERPVETLLATQVLAEGVNLQECGVVVHYDLPWNPTRLIQRNGRVDRRINPTYEDPERRAALLHSMEEAAERTKDGRIPVQFRAEEAPIFHKPKQIYHMTVVPPEPELDGVNDDTLIRRVRQRIFLKLETIRALFGLSTWPVVLDRESARRVLSGELDYETPGFRRREDLFAAWARLRDVNAHADNEKTVSDTPQSFVVHVPSRFAERLADAMAGPAANADPEAERRQQWAARFQGAALLQSSRFHHDTRPVRSIAEHNRLPERVGCVNGALLVSGTNASAANLKTSGISVWGIQSLDKEREQFVPHLAESTGEAWEFVLSNLDLTTLNVDQDETPSLSSHAPASPAAIAEDILVELVELALDDNAPLRIRSRSKTLDVEKDVLAQHIDLFDTNAWFTEHLFRASSDWQTGTSIYLGDEAQDDPPASRPANIWILPSDDGSLLQEEPSPPKRSESPSPDFFPS